ncbi:MAG: sigma-70 family RNA polymerase sigma factor [Defluviitaleaceae bacterium]|nr:sigma-70 family RNA polymerase sigma factor [Defluviitaleaceae bacterium]
MIETEVYEKYVDMLFRVCLSYVKDQAEAEDVAADVFVKFLEHRRKRGENFEDDEHVKAWLLRAAINLCKDRLKHWRRKLLDIDDCKYIESPKSSDNEVLNAVINLPERYKAVIYLYYYEGYSSEEIAGILRKPRSTILNHMSEARKLLKGVLQDNGHEEEEPKRKDRKRLEQPKPKRRGETTYYEEYTHETGNIAKTI